ncbi:tRNA-dihydrouridine synthase [Candidatus Pacearchaeota archaeon]|nr:tRNA-dihydrouridine synthase [Candidatus Pacearchaeota archaeon]
MQENFWKKIAKRRPFFALAPMSDVTDIAFRQMIAKKSRHGKIGGGPDVFWTEFVSADGLASEEGRKNLLFNLKFSKKEKPIIAQIFGSHPEKIKIASEIILDLGFDGIDINMGCPDRSVEKQGAGASLMKNPKLARKIIRSAIEGVRGKIPVSVKTRIGYNKIEYKKWLSEIIKEDISALTIHLRTRKELSDVPAHWELAREIVDFVWSQKRDLILIGNGDIKTKEEGIEFAQKSGFDGIMIGRGIFGNPWFFDSKKKKEISVKEKLTALLEHIKIFDKELLKKGHKNFAVMKKHFKAYVNGFGGAKELRVKLMNTNNFKEVEKIIKNYLKAK